MQVPDLLHNPARRFPGRVCVAEGARSLTFAQADRRAERLAAGLRARGVRRGDRVALLAFNELEYLEIQVGVQRAEAILVPLNFRLSVAELSRIVDDCAPALLIHGPGLAETASQLSVPVTFHLGEHGHGEPYDSLLAAGSVAVAGAPSVLDAATVADILYTSGTTGQPKGAVLTNHGLYARSEALALEIRAAPGSVFVQTLPMFHIAANTAYSFTYTGSTIVLLREFSVQAVVETLHATRATHVLLVPATINLIANHPGIEHERFDDLRMVIYGASPIAPQVLKRAISVFNCGFFQLYGMTETCACSVLRPEDHDPERHPELLASAGTDALSFQTLVVDAEGRVCAPGVVGEIVASGPALMSEYWRNPAETTAALRSGWMHTGDLGYRSEDGYLFVTDRLKDMVVTGGENVYPREVEDVLYAHPGVLEATVIGVPDPRWGERVHAIVVARPGQLAPSAPELIAHCRVSLAAYKCPKTVDFADALPKNATGKVLKRELRARYGQLTAVVAD